MSPKRFIKIFILLAIVVLILISLHIALSETKLLDYLSGNLLPELAGFVLEGLVFVGLVLYFQNQQKIADLKILKSALSQPLSFIIEAFSGNPFHWCKHILHCEPLSEYEDKFSGYFEEMEKNKCIQITPLQKKGNH